jgi:hypothetical protein
VLGLIEVGVKALAAKRSEAKTANVKIMATIGNHTAS